MPRIRLRVRAKDSSTTTTDYLREEMTVDADMMTDNYSHTYKVKSMAYSPTVNDRLVAYGPGVTLDVAKALQVERVPIRRRLKALDGRQR